MRGAQHNAASRLLGRVIAGRYRLTELLGEGGMGEVYRAVDPEGGAHAIKILHYALLGSEATPRFLREASLMRRIESRHVVPTLDAGHDPANDALFIVMPLLEGTDVAELLGRIGPLHPLPAVRIALQAARGLAAAHALGAVHRDVKPANLFLANVENGDVVVRVCDFGVAKLVADVDQVDLTATGSRIGSPLYMSPEQLRSSKHVDQRSDVWSLGTTLYEMLCGRAPFAQGESVAAIVMSVSTRDAPPLRNLAPWVAPGLARVVHRAIERDPERRFPSMTAFSDALFDYAAGEDQLTESMLMPVPIEMRRDAMTDSDLEIGQRTVVSPTDPAPAADRVIGQLLDGRYRVVGLLGRGGMGAVYEVIAPDGRRHAAKLILRDAGGSDKNALKRFVREARAAVDIDSPYVARTFEAGADSALNMPFIIMELMSGTDLGTLIKREGPLEASLVVRIFLQAANGVAAAHARGIIHRDIKPANLFLQQDEHARIVAKVCDFGIAKLVTGDPDAQTQELTRTGGVIGSPLYMSPEQARNAKNVDFHTDIWSLCASFWEALSGRRLWEGNTALGEIILAICSEPIPDLLEAAPWVDPALARIVQRGLERDPKLRWSSVVEMIEALEVLVGSERDVRMDELRGVNHQARVSAQRLSVSTGGGVSGDAPTVAASSNTMAGSSHETSSVARAKRGGRLLAAGGVALAIGTLGVLFGLRSTREKTETPRPAPDPTVAATTPLSARAEVLPAKPPIGQPGRRPAAARLELSVVPAQASLSIGGKPLGVRDGRALLQGEPGDTFEVVAKTERAEKRVRVFVTRDYTLEPSSIELEAPVTRPSVVQKVPKPAKPSAESTSVAASLRPNAERPSAGAVESKPANKPVNPSVKPKDDW